MAIVAYGETASLVLPPTTVTEEKREGLHGRVPRRVLEQTLRLLCLECICICEFVFLLVFVYFPAVMIFADTFTTDQLITDLPFAVVFVCCLFVADTFTTDQLITDLPFAVHCKEIQLGANLITVGKDLKVHTSLRSKQIDH